MMLGAVLHVTAADTTQSTLNRRQISHSQSCSGARGQLMITVISPLNYLGCQLCEIATFTHNHRSTYLRP